MKKKRSITIKSNLPLDSRGRAQTRADTVAGPRQKNRKTRNIRNVLRFLKLQIFDRYEL